MAYGTMSIGNAGFTKKFISALFLLMHPVGTPYASENSTSPAELYGGMWERIEGKFIMGASDAYPAGSTGGSATHVQTVAEIAKHNHIFAGWAITTGDKANGPVGNNQSELFSSTSMGMQSTGESKPMDILNPYYSMYIWRRIA